MALTVKTMGDALPPDPSIFLHEVLLAYGDQGAHHPQPQITMRLQPVLFHPGRKNNCAWPGVSWTFKSDAATIDRVRLCFETLARHIGKVGAEHIQALLTSNGEAINDWLSDPEGVARAVASRQRVRPTQLRSTLKPPRRKRGPR